MIDEKITSFLTRHRISVLSLLRSDNSVHGATVHFAHTDSPFEIVIVTETGSRKASALMPGKTAQASVVVGFSEEEWVELQMSGTVRMAVGADEHLKAKNAFELKFGGEIKDDKVILLFTPAWWRYTEFKRTDGAHIEQTNRD